MTMMHSRCRRAPTPALPRKRERVKESGFPLVRARYLRASSRRRPGPITPGLRDYERHLPPRQHETTRHMGPGVRDDALRRDRPHQIRLSSSGLTGRSSTPRRLNSFSDALEYWIPACAG